MVTAGEPGIDLAGMREYLSQTEVVFAILFGSHARGTAEPTSDVDIALRFPAEMSDGERFRSRNRIDADLQQYADGFVDVSEFEALPTPVAHAALRDGIRLVGGETAVESYRHRIDEEYEATADERERERREFVRRLAEGDA